MSEIANYFLAKQTLAQLHACPFGNSRMTGVDLFGESRIYNALDGAPTFGLPYLMSGAVLSGVRSAGYAERYSVVFLDDPVAIFNSHSDSQQFSQRAQRSRDIRAVNLQAQAPLARVYEFEKPFPEERSFNPRIPETPKILKLRK